MSFINGFSMAFNRSLPKYFSLTEVHTIITNKLKTHNYKSYFLCLFLWNTGVRVSEALNVRLGDIDFIGKAIRIKTLKRQGHERVIPLQDRFIRELRTWINHNELEGQDRLFDYTRRTALNYVKIACHKAGITDIRSHPHTFRHSFAVNCIAQGVPITVLQEWLGHRDITKTLIYTKILAKDSRAFIEAVRM